MPDWARGTQRFQGNGSCVVWFSAISWVREGTAAERPFDTDQAGDGPAGCGRGIRPIGPGSRALFHLARGDRRHDHTHPNPTRPADLALVRHRLGPPPGTPPRAQDLAAGGRQRAAAPAAPGAPAGGRGRATPEAGPARGRTPAPAPCRATPPPQRRPGRRARPPAPVYLAQVVPPL